MSKNLYSYLFLTVGSDKLLGREMVYNSLDTAFRLGYRSIGKKQPI